MRSYGLIGFPLEHSFSATYFTEKFLREGKEEQYLNFELKEIDELPGILERHPGLAGFNVTIPYKKKVIRFLDSLDPVAAGANAVNTVRIVYKAGQRFLEGYNTDVHGFWQSLSPLLKSPPGKALIFGSGGASAAVQYALREAGIDYLLVSRHPRDKGMIGYGDITPAVMKRFNVLINTTPLGTFPNTETFPPIPYNLITADHLLFDLVYNPAETEFLRRGRQQGATVKNGYEMLVHQAEKAYQIWNSLA